MLRVLMVSKAFGRCAYRAQLARIAAASQVAHFTLLASPSWIDEGHTYPFEPGDAPGLDVRIEPIVFNGNFHFYFWPALRRVLREVRPHLVHVDEEPYNLAAFLATRAARRVGARTVFFTWQNICKTYPPPFGWFERYVYARSAVAIAGNHAAESVLRRKGYRRPVRVIPQVGIDPQLFSPVVEAPAGEQVPTIGFAGRLVAAKGIRVLLEAVARVRTPCRLHVIGSGPLEAAAHAHAERLGLGNRVVWERAVPSVSMPARFRTFDLFVLPSLTTPTWKEQFGRVLIEAMACGVPVIGSDSGEIPHVIGPAGSVVPEGDPVALAQTITALLADTPRRQALARAGRARVLERFTQDQIARQMVEAYVEAAAPAHLTAA